jgi:LysR family glycine cleavage system transcriptional activator
MVDLDLEKVDVAVRYGKGNYPGFHAVKLASDGYVPACSSSHFAVKRFSKPPALRQVDLLHDDYPDAWARWFEHAGSPGVTPKRSVEYSESSMLVEAALLGQGVALCRQSLITNELHSRRLTRLFEAVPPLACELGYYTLVSDHALERPLVGTFLTWLRQQVSLAQLPP